MRRTMITVGCRVRWTASRSSLGIMRVVSNDSSRVRRRGRYMGGGCRASGSIHLIMTRVGLRMSYLMMVRQEDRHPAASVKRHARQTACRCPTWRTIRHTITTNSHRPSEPPSTNRSQPPPLSSPPTNPPTPHPPSPPTPPPHPAKTPTPPLQNSAPSLEPSTTRP